MASKNAIQNALQQLGKMPASKVSRRLLKWYKYTKLSLEKNKK